MNAHAPMFQADTAVPITDPTPLPLWRDLVAEVLAANADWQLKCGITDPVTLGREPTEDETAIWTAAHERDEATMRAMLAYAPADLSEYLEKAAMLGDEELVAGLEDDCLAALVRDAKAMSAADAPLLMLDEKLGMRWCIEKLACTSGVEDKVLDAICASTGEVASEIMALPAAMTLDGMRVKARAIAWCFSKEQPEFGGTSGHPEAADAWAE